MFSLLFGVWGVLNISDKNEDIGIQCNLGDEGPYEAHSAIE